MSTSSIRRSRSPRSREMAPGLSTSPDYKDSENINILSYYQSSDAGRSYRSVDKEITGIHTRNISSRSSTPSHYSTDSSKEGQETYRKPQQPPTPHKTAVQRHMIPSEGGSDRRRVAVLQMSSVPTGEEKSQHSDQRYTGTASPSNSIRSRRGLEARLALVAPPDASPKAYAQLTPPPTAPVPHAQPRNVAANVSSTGGHTRSSSEVVGLGNSYGHVRRSSREVGGADITEKQPSPSSPSEITNPLPYQATPSSPSVADTPNVYASVTSRIQDTLSPAVYPISEKKEVLTPGIGESKDISDPVVTPLYHDTSNSPNSTAQPQTWPLKFPTMAPSTTHAPFSLAIQSPYLYYQPGFHATAGPLPPPPVLLNINPNTPPPPRPPRLNTPMRRRGDMDAVKQALQLPASVSAALRTVPTSISTSPKKADPSPTQSERHDNSAKSSPASDMVDQGSNQPSHTREGAFPPSREVTDMSEQHDNSANPDADISYRSSSSHSHTREGAFPPSRQITDTNSTSYSQEESSILRHDSIDDLVVVIGNAIDDMGIMNSSDVPPPTVIEPPRRSEGNGKGGLEIRRQSVTPPEMARGATPTTDESTDLTSPDLDRALPLTPVSSISPWSEKEPENSGNVKGIRGSFVHLKRFSSLPRTPSLTSLNRRSSGSRSSKTTSGSVSHGAHRPPPEKIKSSWPEAMDFADVIVKKSALERSLGYAQKINELYVYDCGLRDWVAETKYSGNNSNSSSKRNVRGSAEARSPSSAPHIPQVRHISQSSMTSEITFPKRDDSYSATDLSARPAMGRDLPNSPPALPYPALAAIPPRSAPTRAATILITSPMMAARSLTISSKSPGNFFASLGRRTSVKNEKNGGSPSPPSPAKVLRKGPSKAIPPPTPRVVNIQNSPSVPGGPRAPSNRLQRSQTFMVSPQVSPSKSSSQRSSTITGRPSLFGGRASAERSDESSPEFARQVDKLAALLPNADKTVLAGYLRRAGQDLLAIGQYLEDEKNGTVRHD